jgi:hypothetical protein
VEHIFGAGHGTVCPLVRGFETDEDALILHGNGDSVPSMAALAEADRRMLAPRLAALLPDMPVHMRAGLPALLLGNLEHVVEVRAQSERRQRELDIEHREWTICLGGGFDFPHTPIVALIVDPYGPNLDGPVRTVAAIIRENMSAVRIPDDGFLPLASVPYDANSVDRARADERMKVRTGCCRPGTRQRQNRSAA